MEESELISESYLDKARGIVNEVEAGNFDAADKLVEELSSSRDKSLFQELGKLTRQFHDALNSFREDSRLAEIAGTEIPDARERLQHVIQTTEKSAHKTMGVIEDLLPMCEDLDEQGNNIKELWQRFMKRDMEAQEFRELCKEIEDYLGKQHGGNDKIRSGLTEIMMAQDFQDITGQIISRVITLVSDLEVSMVNLIREGGQVMEDAKRVTGEEDDSRAKLDGPQVPGIDSEGAVSGQDEVDDLLSSLGF